MAIADIDMTGRRATGPGALQWGAIVLLGITWGATFVGINVALEGFTPLWVAAGRLALGGALLAALSGFVPRAETAPADGSRWPWLLFIGSVGAALPFFLLSWGQLHVSSGFAGVTMASVALMVLPLAHLLVPGERMTPWKAAGVAVGFAGVVTLFSGRFEGGGHLLGQLACVGGAACYAMASIATRLCPPMDPVRLAAGQLVVGAAIVVPIALLHEGPPPVPEMRPLVALALLALIPTATANLLRVFVIRTAGPQFMSMTNYMVPIWAVIFGAALLGEGTPPTLLAALVLILSGIAVTRGAEIAARLRRRP